ncbi:VOC family protein [Paenibacillus sp. PCH8]|uniref:VOC family protein n=1 Tax=Paenibacillus sp. PCH8 TaxID=2066524 RepID=UPI0026B141DC|nr:VOC family protein [Paenibacillus sp. PCH8]
MSSQKRMDHIGITVRDLETTLRFYTEIVGLELKDRVTPTNGVIGRESAFRIGADV